MSMRAMSESESLGRRNAAEFDRIGCQRQPCEGLAGSKRTWIEDQRVFHVHLPQRCGVANASDLWERKQIEMMAIFPSRAISQPKGCGPNHCVNKMLKLSQLGLRFDDCGAHELTLKVAPSHDELM